MQKANYANFDTDPVHMLTESIDNSIFQAAAEALTAANPNLKDASGSSHDCCANKKRSRGKASEKITQIPLIQMMRMKLMMILTLDFQWNTKMIHLIPQKMSILVTRSFLKISPRH